MNIIESYLQNIQEKKNEDNHIVELEITPQFKDDTLPLLDYIKRVAGIGHSFSIIVDPDSSDYKKSFGMDGDGSSHIVSIKLDGKEYKTDQKIT